MSVPRKRTFVTSLISSLPKSNTSSTQNPLKQASADEKSVLLTLHVLFPNELLSALDLLDRELVTRLLVVRSDTSNEDQKIDQSHIDDQDQPTTNPVAELIDEVPSLLVQQQPPTQSDAKHKTNNQNPIYYVRSAQQQSSHSRFRDPISSTTHYEVRPLAWNCSCPAFIFSAFPASKPLQSSTPHEDDPGMESEAKVSGQDWKAGGLSLGEDVPMCKHLLACVLAERGEAFGKFVKTREVSAEEMAGWAAGWGG